MNVYRTLREKGTQKDVLDRMQTRAELYEVLGYHDYERKLDELFADEKKDEFGAATVLTVRTCAYSSP